jgi:hypothetical protein
MTLAHVLKQTESFEIPVGESTVAVTVKKWPLGFYEYQRAKYFEGKDVEFDKQGNVRRVVSVGKFSVDDAADKIFNGVKSWGFVDDKGFAVEITEGNSRALVVDYPDLAKTILEKVEEFNRPASDEVKKN